MLLLFSLLGIMLLSALTVVAMPFAMQHKLLSGSFFSLVTSMTALSLGLYHFSGDHQALQQWFAHGKQHYQLMEKFDQLGGIEGVIARIKKKLQENPNDREGWLILGKLYLSQQKYDEAQAALNKARQIEAH